MLHTKHSWDNDQRNRKANNTLMVASDALDFFKNVLSLDNDRILGLKNKRIEYPADFGKFCSYSITITINCNRMCSDNVAFNGLS